MKTSNFKKTYTKKGKDYSQEEIDGAIKNVIWEQFRTKNLPFCQGEVLKAAIDQCNIPISKIQKMFLHGVIKETHGFYALDIDYKNGKAYVYIADAGNKACIVASDFFENKTETDLA